MIGNILREVRDRNKRAHKYDFGHLLVIGGSKLYSGSPTFNSLAAYRSGVDLVTTATPERAADTIASFSPSLITQPLEGDYFDEDHIEEIQEIKEKTDAVVIGGGMGRKQETKDAVCKLLKNLDMPAVIDADGIHAVSEDKDVLQEDFILTPHAGEFEVLTGEKPEAETEERKKQVKRVAGELGCVVLLKGRNDVVSDGDSVHHKAVGNEYLTVGGTGDTLAGIAGSLLAQGFGSLEAAFGAAWINGKAGEMAGEEKGPGMVPDDLLDKIPRAITER